MQNFIFTCGDVNGVGPEICIKTADKIFRPGKFNLTIICPLNVFKSVAKSVKPGFDYSVIHHPDEISIIDRKVKILDIGEVKMNPGQPTKQSGKASVKAIQTAVKFLLKNSNGAVVTAPVSKTAFEKAGITYPGHTELLAELCNAKKFMMMFLSPKMKCGLATIHIPVKEVSGKLKRSLIKEKIEVLHNSLRTDFGIQEPGIAVLGLNPHAGEEGRIGSEEIKTITPAIASIKIQGIYGPFVPDAFFGKHLYKKYDGVLGMYHDQLLIPFKMLSFQNGVNFTAGLPIVRTSPDHGTAYDIAGKGTANPGSMIAAFKYAKQISSLRERLRHGR